LTEQIVKGLTKRQIWTNEEIVEAEALLNLCNAYEQLHIRIFPTMLRSRPGNETNDFLYYEDGQLVGLLSLDDMGKEDREMTGMVHPEYRRRGIFTLLLTQAKEEAQRRHIQRLVIVCERFSRSGLAFVESTGAAYDFSEHKMELQHYQPHGAFSPALQLIKADTNDIDVIASIIAASFGQSVEGAREHVVESIGTSTTQYYLATFENEPVGCLDVFYSDNGTAGIYGFGILPSFRRRGFGRQILERTINLIRAEEGKEKYIELEVETDNDNAIALYRSIGFVEVTTYGYYNLDVE
jgi:ribosomal protein S18 acetylase RimI-like enzyme